MVWDSNPGPVKSDTPPNSSPPLHVSSELHCPGFKPRRLTSPLAYTSEYSEDFFDSFLFQKVTVLKEDGAEETAMVIDPTMLDDSASNSTGLLH